jgi:hypothetical protein
MFGNSESGAYLHGRLAVFLEYQFFPALSLRIEPSIARRRDDVILSNDSGMEADVWAVFQFLEFNALAVIRPFARQRNLYLLGGGGPGWLQGYWLYLPKEARNTLNVSQARVHKEWLGWRQNVWLAEGGLGYAFPIGSQSRLFAEGRMQFDLTDLYTAATSTLKFRTILIDIGYRHTF